MVAVNTILSTLAAFAVFTQVSNAAPIQKRTLNASAPLASDIGGAHLLLLNDVDSATAKNAFLMLSQPRDYYDGMSACNSMGEAGYIYISGTAGASDLVTLLNNNAPAQVEVSAFSQFWVFNGVPGVLSNCLALNKKTGNTDWIPCSTQLPTVCFNSVARRVLLFADTSKQVKVNTPVGQIQGWRDQNAFRFLGIPYAEAPVGNLRFMAPVAKAPFSATLDATAYRGICPQTTQAAGFIPLVESYLENGAAEMEDCLNINVYTPSLKGTGQAGLPVMFYIHGGGFTTYSGSVIIFEPGNMVSRGGVVVVTINYRLGMLGWFEDDTAWPRSNVPGNQAFRDQILALQWVQKNIASFGGDPTRVTVFGESAGATSIRAMLSAPTAWGLYQSVIGESDPINIPFKTAAKAATITQYFMQALGCADNDLACAQSKSVNDVLTAQTTANANALADDKWTTWALVERPTIDGVLIASEFSQLVKTGQYNTKANIMWGTVHDEAGLFVPQYFPNPLPVANLSSALEVFFDANRTAQILASEYFQLNSSDTDAVRDLFTLAGTEYYFLCPLRYLSRQMTKIKNVYNFRFNRGRDIPLVGQSYCSSSTGRVCHSMDIQPVFASGDAVPTISQTGDDARFARQVVDRFTTFAKTANPNPQANQQGVESTNPDVTSVNWMPYDDTNPILELNVQSSMSINAQSAPCNWLDTVFLYEFWLEVPGNSP
ncbi:Carboxylesterase family-domain-containing protein [Dissophora ornata]|nr:hypothetical protein BGZ58_000002 [Dissophora ornata]KAI8604308.1 Carboxylesterase family-domain-containing protein [Dissophora ornata]